MGFDWYDPYHGRGGLGASSAQFLSLYRARQIMLNLPESAADLLEQYWCFAWSGKGFRPSGYDVLAQSSGRCVVIEGGGVPTKSVAWPFPTLGFLLLHTGQKLATHTHLQTLSDISAMKALVSLAAQACVAFETYDSALFIEKVNAYHAHLLHLGLVAPYTEHCINALIEREDVLAAKGCGAMGADVLLILTPISRLDRLQHALRAQGWEILATAADLYEMPKKI
jgi:mevalonate kinase